MQSPIWSNWPAMADMVDFAQPVAALASKADFKSSDSNEVKDHAQEASFCGRQVPARAQREGGAGQGYCQISWFQRLILPTHGGLTRIDSENAGNSGKLPSRRVEIGFWIVSKPLAGWEDPKMGLEWSRTLPKTSQKPREANSLIP